MVVLLLIGRQSVVAQVRSGYKKPNRSRPVVAMAQQRHLRAAPAQSETGAQTAKSSSNWPESISTFFHPSRQNDATALPEVVMECGGNDGGVGPPPRGNSGGDGDEAHSDSGALGDDLLNLAEAESLAAEKGARLPGDFLKAAKTSGLRSETLHKYLELQSRLWVGLLVSMFPWVRDRLIADPAYLFKVFTEVFIDSGCATLAEVRKRGANFFDEIEFYMSDMIVGLVLDVALVSLLAPVAVVGAKPLSSAKTGIGKYLAKLPSAFFEADIKGIREYTMSQRIVSFFYKGLQYAALGFACGLVGQGMANSLMVLRRHLAGGATESDVAVPPLFKSALVWAMFMGVSSNTRYQIVVGLERLVDVSIAKHVPQVAYFTTIAIRFVNNVIGGENFIDMARWAGIQ